MNTFRLLMTKRISPSLVLQAGLKGIDILEKEFISITRIMNDQLSKKINKLSGTKATVVFTSKNSVRAIENHLTPQPDWKVFCIDGATKKEVLKYFPPAAVSGTAVNAEKLANIIVANSKDNKIVFFCGNKRMDELPLILQSNGFDVEELIVYKTDVTPQKIVDDFDGVAFFSPSAVESFFSLNQLNGNVVCFSVGNATTEKIKKYSSNRVFTSDKPSDQTVVDMVVGVARMM